MLVLWICLEFSYAFGIINGQSLQLTQSPFRNVQYSKASINNQTNNNTKNDLLLGNVGLPGISAILGDSASSSTIRRNLNNYIAKSNTSASGDQLTASAIQSADKLPSPNTNYKTFNFQPYNYKNNQPATRMKFFSEPTAYKPGAISNILSHTNPNGNPNRNPNGNSNNYRFTTTTTATTTKLPIIEQKPDFYNRQLLPTATETGGHLNKLKFTPKISLPAYHDFHLTQLQLNTTHTQSLSSDTKHLPTYVPVFSYTSEIYHVNASDDQYQTNTPPYQQQLNSRKQRSLPYEYYPINNNIANWNSAIYHDNDYNNYNYNYNNYNGNNYYNNNNNNNNDNDNYHNDNNFTNDNNNNNNYGNENENENENEYEYENDGDISDEENKADINQDIISAEEDMDYNNAINLPKSLDDNRLDIDLIPAKKIRYFHDFFIKYLGPHHVSFGHVERHPRLFETRFQTIRDSNRYKGEVIWSDNKGGYAEHYWDLAIGKI